MKMRCFCRQPRIHHYKIVLLDDREIFHEMEEDGMGLELLDAVFTHLNLSESCYFGLRYLDYDNQTRWLEATKKAAKQLKGKETFVLYFGVKFYAVDPCKLAEEITRYQFFLQAKRDILQGRLPVTFDLAAELGAYAVQSELGDFDARKHSAGYVSEFHFVADQTLELECKIAELHKTLRGQLPSVAESNYLDKVKWVELYGADLHPVIGEENVEYFVGLTPTGVIVLRNKSKVANYYWTRISKIYRKGKYFMLRVCDKNNEENTYGFETPSHGACKHLRKCCSQHREFFNTVHVSSNVANARFGGNKKSSSAVSPFGLGKATSFERTPSRRYRRRETNSGVGVAESEEKKIYASDTLGGNSRSVYSIPSQPRPNPANRSDSPRSTRSAPAPWNVWGSAYAYQSGVRPFVHARSSHSPPRSVRSAGAPSYRSYRSHRASSVESRSSGEESHSRHRRGDRCNKRGSDNESEVSKCSSRRHRRHRRRSGRSSGSEHCGGTTCDRDRLQMVDSEEQWRRVQRGRLDGSDDRVIGRATVVSAHSGYTNDAVETESDIISHYHHRRRRHRKHRSRSRSPGEGGKSRLPAELKEHLEFQLVETDGMSEQQLRQIPYKEVRTSGGGAATAIKVKLASSSSKTHRRRPRSLRKDSSIECASDECAPPATYAEGGESPSSDLSSKTTSTLEDGRCGTGTSTSSGFGSTGNCSAPGLASRAIARNGRADTNERWPSSAALYGSCSALYGATHSAKSEKDTVGSNDGTPLSARLPPQPRRISVNDDAFESAHLSIRSSYGKGGKCVSDAVRCDWSPSNATNINESAMRDYQHQQRLGSTNRSRPPSADKLKKNDAMVESGVLRSHVSTAEGTVAWTHKCAKNINNGDGNRWYAGKPALSSQSPRGNGFLDSDSTPYATNATDGWSPKPKAANENATTTFANGPLVFTRQNSNTTNCISPVSTKCEENVRPSYFGGDDARRHFSNAAPRYNVNNGNYSPMANGYSTESNANGGNVNLNHRVLQNERIAREIRTQL